MGSEQKETLAQLAQRGVIRPEDPEKVAAAIAANDALIAQAQKKLEESGIKPPVNP